MVYPITYRPDVDVKSQSFVYSLTCPIRNIIFYIGKANDPQTRYRKHLSQLKNRTLKNNYIKWIITNGKKPIMTILFGGNEIDALAKKTLYIKNSLEAGIKLTNMTIGGDGGNTFGGRVHSQESRDKISKANSGKKRDLGYLNSLKRKAVIQIDPTTHKTIATFASVVQASELTGCSKTNIGKMANGNIKPSIKLVGGYKWGYLKISA